MITKICFISPKINSYNSNPISKISFKSSKIGLNCDVFIKSKDKKTLYETGKNKLLSFGLSDSQCLAYLSCDADKFNKIIKALENGAKFEELDKILKLSEKQFDRYLNIRQETSQALKIVIFDDERYERALQLLKKGVNVTDVIVLSEEQGEKFQKISKFFNDNDDEIATCLAHDKLLSKCIQMHDLGVNPSEFSRMLSFDDVKYNKALYVAKYSPDRDLKNTYIFGLSDTSFEKAKKLLKEGLDAHCVPAILSYSEAWNRYSKLSKIYNKRDASILACISDFFYSMDGASKDTMAKLIDNVSLNPKLAQEDLSKKFHGLVMRGVNFEELNKYINKFDFKKISKLAPAIKNYSPEDLLDFYVYHYKKSDNILDKKTLECDNFENYLSQNLVDAKDLTKLLIRFPLTKREIGDIPSDWLNNLSEFNLNDIKDEISNAILSFGKTKSEEDFCKSMAKILNKNVAITRLPAGAFGKCYRLKIDDAQDTCLKLFKTSGSNVLHGASCEPQVALFANNNSNDFVKMFFARTAPIGEKDAYIVTQYLDKTIKPIETKKTFGVKVYCEDALGANIINGKIIDFGAVKVIDTNKNSKKENLLDF